MATDHEKYGLETACPRCSSKVVVAMSHTTSATEPHEVRAVCSKLSCEWRGPLLLATEAMQTSITKVVSAQPPVAAPIVDSSKATKKKPSPKQVEMF